jgi:hypothetical protein
MQPVNPDVVREAVSKLYAMQGMPEYPQVDEVVTAILAHVEEDRQMNENMTRTYKRLASFIRRRRTTAMVNRGN